MIIAFWAILIMVVVGRLYYKHSTPSRHDNLREAFFGKKKQKQPEPIITGNAGFEITPEMRKAEEQMKADAEVRKAEIEAQKAQKLIDQQRQRDIDDLKRQGYTDDMIAMIIPIVNDGQ